MENYSTDQLKITLIVTKSTREGRTLNTNKVKKGRKTTHSTHIKT